MKKKILFLIHTLTGGGAEKILINLVSNLDREKYDITLMTVVDTGIYRNAIPEHVKYKTIFHLINNKKSFGRSGNLLAQTSALKKVIIKIYTSLWKYVPEKMIYKIAVKEKFDYEVAFLEGICAKIISGSTNNESTKYAWIHVDIEHQHKSSNVFRSIKEESEVYNKFNKIICVSESVKDHFAKCLKIEINKLIVKYNPIDENEIILKSKIKSKESYININKRKITLCAVGRLNSQKSYIRLLQCCKSLFDKGYDFDLWIIGEGGEYKKLNEFIINSGLSDKVFLLGFIDNPYYYMALADLFVCSSIAEGFSTVAAEATILGIPIVTTECAGMRELLGDNEFGIITENSVDGLYGGIKRILDSPELMQYYKNQSKKRGKTFKIKEAIYEIQKLF